MNKKGSFGLIFYIILLTALTISIIVTNNPDYDINSFKINLNWTNVNITSLENAPDLGNAIESLINGVGEAFFSVMKWVAQWSSENPTIPFKLIFCLVILSILLPILYYLGMGLIILVILIKEKIRRKKEKNELNRLRKKEDGTRN